MGPLWSVHGTAEWDALPSEERARMKSRQGVPYHMLDDLMVADADTMEPVPKDGETMGEIFFRGNIVMKGYLKNPATTEEAFSRRMVPFG